MNITLLSEPTNSSCNGYRGLYRQNLDFNSEMVNKAYRNNKEYKQLVDWFIGQYCIVDYSEDSVNKLLKLKEISGKDGSFEIIFFDDSEKQFKKEGFVFLGYDICADSKYYSPLGDAVLTNYNDANLFIHNMGKEKYQYYVSYINKYKLFKDLSVAIDFSKYLNNINSKTHIIESEENWRPFSIYSLT